MITIPTTINDSNVRTRTIKFSNPIEQTSILYESITRSIISIKMDNQESKIYQLNQIDSSIEWNFNELDQQIKSNGFYSIGNEKTSPGHQLLEASSNEQKINFHLSTITDQTLSNKRSYSVQLPENMGDIEYLAYSTVKHTSLVTLRMQDASLLVIKLTDNGGRETIFYSRDRIERVL